MNTFYRFFYEFTSIFIGGFITIFKGLVRGVTEMFRIKDYLKVINSYEDSFGSKEWIFVTLAIGIIVIIIGLFGLLIFLWIRRMIRVRKTKLNQEDLLDEIGNLNSRIKKLMKEKDEIMAMKVSQLGLKPGEDPNEKLPEDKKDGEEEVKGDPNVRFPKLDLIDQQNKTTKIKNYGNTYTLEELIDDFRCFSATKLKLFYDASLLRAFFSGLACGKLIILQGISGTGKTSLAYAWGKFVNQDSCVASVAPSWHDKTELLGYFNEFTKKFNETNVLAELYSASFDDNVHTIILDEMNLARVEYYFAEMLSILEMPSRDEWIIELVTNSWPSDPKKINYGKLKLPGNLWYIGTINNDDSTFMVTDKVYDRAMPIDINTKVEPFKCREQEAMDINSTYLESLFRTAMEERPISDKNLEKVKELDDYVIKHFRVAFGNRIMKQLKTFVPVYVACGGKEVAGIDYFIAKKIFRKFEQLNIALIKDEIDPFIKYLNKTFGENEMAECIEYVERIKKMA